MYFFFYFSRRNLCHLEFVCLIDRNLEDRGPVRIESKRNNYSRFNFRCLPLPPLEIDPCPREKCTARRCNGRNSSVRARWTVKIGQLGRISGRAVSETICNRGCGFNVGGQDSGAHYGLADRNEYARVFFISVRATRSLSHAAPILDAFIHELKPVLSFISPRSADNRFLRSSRVNCFIGEIPTIFLYPRAITKHTSAGHFMVSGNWAHSSGTHNKSCWSEE